MSEQWKPKDRVLIGDDLCYLIGHRGVDGLWWIARDPEGKDCCGVGSESQFRRPVAIPTLTDRQAALARRQRELIEGNEGTHGERWTVGPKVEVATDRLPLGSHWIFDESSCPYHGLRVEIIADDRSNVPYRFKVVSEGSYFGRTRWGFAYRFKPIPLSTEPEPSPTEKPKHDWRPGMRAIVKAPALKINGLHVMLRNRSSEQWGSGVWDCLVDGDEPRIHPVHESELIPEPSPSPVHLDPREPEAAVGCHGYAMISAPEPGIRLLRWFASDDTGSSAKTMARHLAAKAGIGDWVVERTGGFPDYPYDSSDFGRCVRLLETVPELGLYLPSMSEVSPVWAAIVGAWDGLKAVYLEELPNRNSWKCHNRIRSLINRAEAESNNREPCS